MVNSEEYLQKPLPSSPEAERVILGAIILDNEVIHDAIGYLQPADFYSTFHKRIFQAMIFLIDSSNFENNQAREINPITIGEELKKSGSLDSIGGLGTITNLTYGLPHYSDIIQYCEIVKSKSKARVAIREMSLATSRLLSEEDEVETILFSHETRITEIVQENTSSSFFKIGELVNTQYERAQQVLASGNILTGVSTGFIDLDQKTLGLQKKDLIIIAGRPSMGKTSFATNIAQNIAMEGGKVVFFSLEMSKEQLAIKILCSEAKVDSSRFRIGMIEQMEWAKLQEALASLGMAGIYIDDTPGITTQYMSWKLNQFIREEGVPDCVVVDYMQLMGGNSKSENRQQEVSRISRELKAIAKSNDIPVAALSQLSRKPEERKLNDRRPMLSDLRESGSIEQDADVVAFLYREAYYSGDNTGIDPSITEIIIAKQRTGPTDTVKLRFDLPSSKFENLYYGNTGSENHEDF